MQGQFIKEIILLLVIMQFFKSNRQVNLSQFIPFIRQNSGTL